MTSLTSIIFAANVQIVENGNSEAVADFFTTNYIANVAGAQKTSDETVRGYIKAIHSAFSELTVEVEILAESSETITWQRTIRSKQTGAF